MRINPETVQQIQNRMDIMEVVGDFVSLKKKGQNYWACCPFHNEKTPSFSINPTKGIFKCFGCGKGGDSLTFVMELENYTYPEALQYLAKKYNIEIEEDTRPTDQQLLEQNERESLLVLHEFAKNYFIDLLHNHSEGQTIGLTYFKERGFRTQTIEGFELGYSLAEWDSFSKKALDQGFSQDILEKSGLSIQTDKGGLIDRFRERIIFPIHNVSGKVIGFGGRILKNDKKLAKYVNSPETPIYHKSHVLYGLWQAKKKIREQDNCYLVEGYTDVTALHQADIQNVIASSGTSLTIEQIRLIHRFTENVSILYDGDMAGIKASLRGIDLLLEEGLNVKIVSFPEGEDPDSCIKRIGTTAFQAFLQDNSRDFITFKSILYLKEANDEPVKRAELIQDILNSISKIPDEIKRYIFIQECSKLFKIDEQVLLSEIQRLLQKGSKPNVIHSKIEAQNATYIQEKEAISLLLNYGDVRLENGQKLAIYFVQETDDLSFEEPIYAQILNEFREQIKKNSIPSPDRINKKYPLSDNWEKICNILESEQLQTIVVENILRLKLIPVQKMILENSRKLKQATLDSEQDQCILLGLHLETIRKQIAKQLNNVLIQG